MQIAKQQSEAHRGLQEMQGLEHRFPTAHAIMKRRIEDAGRQITLLERTLRELEGEVTGVRESFEQFHGDLKAVRTLESDPKCLKKEEVAEVFTILGMHGHTWRERLAAIDLSQGPLIAAERRLAYWRARYEGSAGNRSSVLHRVVVRLEQIAQGLASEMAL